MISGAVNDSLGPTHAGVSANLDSLVTYMESIEMRSSPYKNDEESIIKGKLLFTKHECNSCHMQPFYIDMRLHDVGTGVSSKEKNSHGRGTKFDTPSLRGIWMTAPYFHDGSAETLEDVFQLGTTHNISFKMSEQEIADLITFLKSLP